MVKLLLKQLRAGCTGQHAPGFLELLLSVNVCVRVCFYVYVRLSVRPRDLITSGVMWCDIDPIRLIK